MKDLDPARKATDFARVIAPMAPETFLAEVFERRHMVIHRDDPDYFRDLLTVADIDAVLTGTMLPADEMNMVNTGRPVPAERYTTAAGHVDPVRAAREFAAGGTIILPGLQRRLPAQAAYCRALETVFSCDLQTNIYFTPDNAQGFRTHYDSHDVIVLQVHGTKTWKIYESDLELPLRSQDFRPEGFVPGKVIDEFVLRAGDMAYVPRGVVHDAIATTEQSLHITTGLIGHRWVDLLLEAVADVALRDPDLRRSVTPGLANPGFDPSDAIATLKALMQRTAAAIEPDRILKGLAADFRARRAPVVPGQFLQDAGAGAIGPDTVLARRAGVIWNLSRTKPSDTAEPAVILDVYGTEIRMPLHAEGDLADSLSRAGSFTPRDLSGALDEAGKVVLARRLVREGVLLRVD
jgi:hypothetical protein